MARKQCVPSRATAKLRNRAPSASTMRAVASRGMPRTLTATAMGLPVSRITEETVGRTSLASIEAVKRVITFCIFFILVHHVTSSTGLYDYEKFRWNINRTNWNGLVLCTSWAFSYLLALYASRMAGGRFVGVQSARAGSLSGRMGMLRPSMPARPRRCHASRCDKNGTRQDYALNSGY